MKFSGLLHVLIGFHFFLLFSEEIVTAVVIQRTQSKVECGEHEVYSVCKAHRLCEKSCDNIDTWGSAPCSGIGRSLCKSGCICEQGYVRDNERGTCVWENSCPRVRH